MIPIRKERDLLWPWLIAERAISSQPSDWTRHGGKWIIFDKREKIGGLGERLGPHPDAGEVEGAQILERRPKRTCVYSLDIDRDKVRDLLESLCAGGDRVWEYDYAWDKNIRSPVRFLYSRYSKLTAILRSRLTLFVIILMKSIRNL